MLLVDVVVAALDAQPVRLEQDVRVRVAVRRLEAVRRELDQEPERFLEVDRVHEAAVLDAAVADAALVQPRDGLPERRLRERERDVVDVPGLLRVPDRGRAGLIRRPLLVGEHRDQPPVARVEVEVALRLVVEVRLLEHERHPEDAFPEVDRRLPVGADERDVVDALALELSHSRSESFVFQSLRCKLPWGTSSTWVWTTSTARRRSRIASARRSRDASPGASSTATGSGGSCLTPWE